MAVLLETTLGDVVIDLYTEERPRGEARPRSLFAGAATVFPHASFAAQSRASTISSVWAAGARDRALMLAGLG